MADALMQHLPPIGWADVATKHDLMALEDRLDLRMEAKINGAVNRLLLVLIPTIISGLGLSTLVAKLV